MSNIQEVLLEIQARLKAPKLQNNNFGKYKYRSCEDILEAVKPILNNNNTTLVLSDELINIGERYYIKATATLNYKGESLSVHAYAREELNKKGMDESQITGASSSYARKYALNGLFLIDDTRDSDATNQGNSDKGKLKQVVTSLNEEASEEIEAKNEKKYAGFKEDLESCEDMESLILCWDQIKHKIHRIGFNRKHLLIGLKDRLKEEFNNN